MTTGNREQRKKLAFFVGDELIGIEMINKLIPRVVSEGVLPVIYDTGSHRNRRFKVRPPPEAGFYFTGLYRDTVVPFLEGQAPVLGPDRRPIDGLNYSFRQLADIYQLEYHAIKDVNEPGLSDEIRNDPDIIGGISIRFLQIFEPEILGVFHEKGFFWNVHAGLLPAYKGLLIPIWSIANGEAVYGWTLHHLAEGIDTGGVIATDTIPLDPNDPILMIYSKMVPKGVEMIMAAVRHLLREGPPATIQQPPHDPKTYYPFPPAELRNRLGIVFCPPSDAVDYYAARFALPGSPQERDLRARLAQAVSAFTQRLR